MGYFAIASFGRLMLRRYLHDLVTVKIQRSLERSELLARHLWDEAALPPDFWRELALNFVLEMEQLNSVVMKDNLPNALSVLSSRTITSKNCLVCFDFFELV